MLFAVQYKVQFRLIQDVKDDMKKRKIFTLASLFAALTGAGYATMTYFVDSMTFDREPKAKLPGSREIELKGIAKEGQMWLHEHDTDPRDMVNSDGLRLRAHYIPADNAKRTILAFHGWHGRWDIDFSASSPFLHELGCNLLIVEERGQGESEGQEMTFGKKEYKDVLEWVSWYQKEMDSEIDIYLAGVSMGATAVLLTANADLPSQVKGIVADCGFSSAYEIIRLVGKRSFHTPEHPFMDTLNAYCRKKHGFDLREVDVTEAMEQAKVPILFIHGKADHFVPCWMSAESYEKCNSPKDILLVEGAGHGQSFVKGMESYLEKVRTFFAKYDSTRPE